MLCQLSYTRNRSRSNRKLPTPVAPTGAVGTGEKGQPAARLSPNAGTEPGFLTSSLIPCAACGGEASGSISSTPGAPCPESPSERDNSAFQFRCIPARHTREARRHLLFSISNLMKQRLAGTKTLPRSRFSTDETVQATIFVTTPEPTVLPPSRIAKRLPSVSAIGFPSSTFRRTLSPGMHISAPPNSDVLPVTSVVRK